MPNVLSLVSSLREPFLCRFALLSHRHPLCPYNLPYPGPRSAERAQHCLDWAFDDYDSPRLSFPERSACMKTCRPDLHLLNPLRWTALTWIAVVTWLWAAYPSNYPPSVSYTVDEVTGELTDPTHYSSLSEYPFSVGWPFQYVVPDDPTTPMTPVPTGAPAPPRGPSKVSVLAMIANAILILSAIASLVVLLQTYFPRFSLRLFLMLPLLYPLHLAIARAIGMLGGFRAVERYFNAVYFLPIPLCLLLVFSGTPMWSRIANRNRSAELSR